MRFSALVEILTKNGLVTDRFLPYDPEIEEISEDTRRVKNGTLMVCIKGTRFDSHKAANETSASAFVVQHPIETDRPFVVVKDQRLAISAVSYNFYGPFDEFRFFGVTGTKGKTTVVTLIKRIIEKHDVKCALMSTVLNSVPDFDDPSEHTTQSPLYTAKLLRLAKDKGVKFAALEASSQGLEMKRLDGISFDRIAFLNLTRDHFDTHVNFENYFEAKVHLLDLVKGNGMVFVNGDSGKWSKLYAERASGKGLKTTIYGKNGDIRLKLTHEGDDGISFDLDIDGKTVRFSSPVIGGFMASNLAAAILMAHSAGFDIEKISRAVEEFGGVEGRLERYHGNGYDFYVDFAHTPGAIETVLKTVRRLTSGRVIIVFGAGGEADRGKRPLMGKSAQRYADLLFLTNDNPKSEDALEIIQEVMAGISDRERLRVIPERKDAIRAALEEWRPGDRIVIAGKGHEKTQIFDGYEIPFNDKDVAFEILRGMGKIETF